MGVREVVELLGLDSGTLENGEIIDTTVHISDVATLRQLFGGSLTDEQRSQFTGGTASSDEHPQMSALIDHVFGSGELSDETRTYAGQVFPVQVRLMAGGTVTIDTDLTVGPLAQPYAIIADNLIFAGGSLTMLATSLTIQAGQVSVKSGSAGKPYHLGILGVDGTQPQQASAGTAYTQPAAAGSNASAPTPGICTGASNGGNGTNGSKGNTGSNGQNGNAGSASYPASITISKFDPASTGVLVLQTQSGAGGTGGQGGDGGTGQDGGSGGSGCDSGCEGTDGGNGGNAGPGGDGGPGGNGTDGINGYPINISFPLASKNMLQTVSLAAPPGGKGVGGNPGGPGNPGGGGSGGKHKSDGQAGSGSGKGQPGADGSAGTNTGAPGQIIPTFT